jgi:hypothetical protein
MTLKNQGFFMIFTLRHQAPALKAKFRRVPPEHLLQLGPVLMAFFS